ncbi:Down syndrome cell adhesion molecule homolog isoform X3 [Tachysurus fulvidraco]|uniref:Down syndrome cell adhesion molecule homolog isoform X3 n=1 Tax=Tachysurus fulvidraco TaxID=1234273 RepID=UPI001FEF7750|nr:Down syndrome cell adhesion molecule homolog isoform X3 [Tachysurus fulvidraco]
MLMFVDSVCNLENELTVDVTGIVGQSALLPCSCSELQAKPNTFKWRFYKGSDDIKIFPKEQTNLYTDRVQVFNDHPPGNLSLLISHLTVEDGGLYRCEINNKISTDIKLTVKDYLSLCSDLLSLLTMIPGLSLIKNTLSFHTCVLPSLTTHHTLYL